ncbi:hypothetical protein ACP70R_045867 [Stipagrostis hirtigluma subsp. patula]
MKFACSASFPRSAWPTTSRLSGRPTARFCMPDSDERTPHSAAATRSAYTRLAAVAARTSCLAAAARSAFLVLGGGGEDHAPRSCGKVFMLLLGGGSEDHAPDGCDEICVFALVGGEVCVLVRGGGGKVHARQQRVCEREKGCWDELRAADTDVEPFHRKFYADLILLRPFLEPVLATRSRNSSPPCTRTACDRYRKQRDPSRYDRVDRHQDLLAGGTLGQIRWWLRPRCRQPSQGRGGARTAEESGETQRRLGGGLIFWCQHRSQRSSS